MPLRDDLLTPIAGDNPSGPDLRYDKVFMQIEEARAEDDETLPTGDWGRTAKKADRVLVLKLAGDLLAKRTKDLRIAGWYLESLVRREGFSQLTGGIDLLWKLQTEFWETVHPEIEEDGNLDLRVGAVEKSALLISNMVKVLPLTRSGVNWIQYQDAKVIGLEAAATTREKQTERSEAIARGAMTGEDLQKSIDETPKAFYVENERYLADSFDLLQEMDEFQQEKYGDDYPSLSRLKSAIEALKHIVGGILTEKRKTDPDEEPAATIEPEPEPEPVDVPSPILPPEPVVSEPIASVPASPVRVVVAAPATATSVPQSVEAARRQVLLAAEYLLKEDAASPVPYLLCSALRLGETRAADLSDPTFPVAPPTETRQALRRMASEGSWNDLMAFALKSLSEPCGRVWLDLHRYIWRAAQASSNPQLALAVASTIRGLLTDLPELRGMMMDDDTPVANAETQQWILSEILPPPPEPVPADPEPEPVPQPVYSTPAPSSAAHPEPSVPDIFETAQEVLKRGRTAEAISMLIRDSEQQPSGRMRFQRRVQMAQLCLIANQHAVAYPVLRDLSTEIERRMLETWETAELLSNPLSLYLRCLDQRNASEEEREIVFERLCRLDPQAAMIVRS